MNFVEVPDVTQGDSQTKIHKGKLISLDILDLAYVVVNDEYMSHGRDLTFTFWIYFDKQVP